MSRIKTVVFGLVLSSSMLIAGAASAATYCQTNGHGASGCELPDGTAGYCWSNTNSPTGYVCKEDKPGTSNSTTPVKESKEIPVTKTKK